ncbi:hypothetical protein HPB50_018456 [Hyalomma asiaticum]|uniref:Uncharacterized protein n=1 Tax=Hyalomma asiaticum TaxID=266040 RepID=A0ACB7RUX4_HYAAI|nr:hypothetical protein HPB50_018456 [Hyalomma asiaticum]
MSGARKHHDTAGSDTKADTEASVDARCMTFQEAFMRSIQATLEKIVQSELEKRATTFEHKIATPNAKIDVIAAQLSNFIVHVKNTYITMTHFESFTNPLHVTRKKPRASSHNASRSVSPTRARRPEIELPNDGHP